MEVTGGTCKIIAIEYSKFRDKYKYDEVKRVRETQDRLGGLITWREASDEVIWEKFIENKSNTKNN